MRSRQHQLRKTIVLLACVLISIGASALKLSGLAAEVREQTVTLQIEGMTCGACVKDVRAALQKVAGVKAVQIHVGTKWAFFSDYSDARASVTFDPEIAAPGVLLKAIETAGTALSTYKARLIQDK
jgi:copper chaperone CopZ